MKKPTKKALRAAARRDYGYDDGVGGKRTKVALRAAASAEYGSDEVQVYEDAEVTPVEDGFWVEGWLWVRYEDV